MDGSYVRGKYACRSVERASALDRVAILKVEELIDSLRERYTVAIGKFG